MQVTMSFPSGQHSASVAKQRSWHECCSFSQRSKDYGCLKREVEMAAAEHWVRPEVYLAYQACHQITKREAKNFYYGFRSLPEPKRYAIYAAYAFCRQCDD